MSASGCWSRCAATRVVRIDPRVHGPWPFLPAEAPAGSVWLGPTGERVRIYADGSADEVGEIPRRWSASADPTATSR